MRAAIAMAAQNQAYPFGAVITNASSGAILARGVNKTFENPILHGEISCMNNYVAQYGNKNWPDLVLYTTGEPCPMCMAALHWARVDTVYYGATIADAELGGFNELQLPAAELLRQGGSTLKLIPGLLPEECKKLFFEWQSNPNHRVY